MSGGGRNGPLRPLWLAFGFFTVLPLGAPGGLPEVAAAGYLLPLIGAVLGGLEGLVAWSSLRLFGPLPAAAITLAAALLLTGLHHMDGLADLGDAVMVHGGPARRLEVLKDRTLGVGAAGTLLLTYLITWAALAQLDAALTGLRLVLSLVAIEVCARLGLMLVAAMSRPSHAGSGSAFITVLKGRPAAAGVAAALAILGLLAWPAGLALIVAAVVATNLVAAVLAAAAARLFGVANGDVLGAAVELGRMAAALASVMAVIKL